MLASAASRSKHRRVARATRADMRLNSLTGPLPPRLGNLFNLTVLLLHANSLTGPIPPELGNLSELEEFSLSFNDLTGPIPLELADLASLDVLSLSGNSLSGEIPPELGMLQRLSVLQLVYNDLSGAVPWELGSICSTSTILAGRATIILAGLTSALCDDRVPRLSYSLAGRTPRSRSGERSCLSPPRSP